MLFCTSRKKLAVVCPEELEIGAITAEDLPARRATLAIEYRIAAIA
jgi:hypothetical protein